MTDEIINGVHELADDEDEEFVFWDRNGDDIPDDEIHCDDVPIAGVLDSELTGVEDDSDDDEENDNDNNDNDEDNDNDNDVICDDDDDEDIEEPQSALNDAEENFDAPAVETVHEADEECSNDDEDHNTVVQTVSKQ